MSIRHLGVCFLALQAISATVWWCVIIGWPALRAPFMVTGAPGATLLAFAVPDAVLVIATSAAAAYGLWGNRRWGWPVLCVHAAPRVRMREARPASRTWNVAKTLVQTAVFWSGFLFVLPSGIVALENRLGLSWWRFAGPAWTWLGGALFVLAGALGLTSGLVMALRGRGTPLPWDSARELVIVGPYRYVRNPMAVAGLTQGVAVGLFLGSPAVVAYALLGGPVWHLLINLWRKRTLGGASANHTAATKPPFAAGCRAGRAMSHEAKTLGAHESDGRITTNRTNVMWTPDDCTVYSR